MSRIIAGTAGGRRIDVPKGRATRPTTDKLKEALFSALISWLGTADVPADKSMADIALIDLFAGSGSIALEAVSRGARAVAVEADRPTSRLISANAASLGLSLENVTSKVSTFLARAPKPFDVVFIDPPYPMTNADVEDVLEALTAGWLVDDPLVVVERSSRGEAFRWPPQFLDCWERRYGETTLFFGTTMVSKD